MQCLCSEMLNDRIELLASFNVYTSFFSRPHTLKFLAQLTNMWLGSQICPYVKERTMNEAVRSDLIPKYKPLK